MLSFLMNFVAAAIPPTPLGDVDAAVDALYDKKDAWTNVAIDARALLLDQCVTSIAKVAERWVDVGARIKGLDPADVRAGEEWLAGVFPALRHARLLARALRSGGKPRPAELRTRADGRTVARVFPSNAMERFLYRGIVADVWIEKGKSASQGAIYSGAGSSSVCLVLGGGNVSSIPVMDALHKLFVENFVVLLKMNPVNAALGPLIAEALAPLVAGGWLEIIYGGAEVGERAAESPKVGALHVTGSDRTYDAIVWGHTPEERSHPVGYHEARERKARGERRNEKPFSAELGCVTPVIVVPGPWSHADIRFQARHVAAMVTNNASFNCTAAKVVIVARQWLQREVFLDALCDELAKTPPRKAYYPGARERYAAFLAHYPQAVVVGSVPASEMDCVPWTVIPEVRTDDGYALQNEAFCGVVAELEVEAPDVHGASVERFLEEAVRVANESCWGTLSCSLLVHPATEQAHSEALTRAVNDLRYGSIGINVWSGAIYGLASSPWGAHPGHRPEDIQSGTGMVHDPWLFDHPEKTVVRAPFRIRPTPAWFSDHKNLLELGRRIVDFEAAPSWGRALRAAFAAIKG
jgi:acyl-CoA reductase-like NAD-dependent aldehyde dehydrogenase